MVCGPLPTKATLAIRENATTKDRYNFDRGFVRYAGDIEILREGTGELQARGRGGRGRARESTLMGQLGVVLSGRISGLGCDGNRSERVGRSPFG